MLVGLARYDLRIPAAASLKEKRHVVKGLTAGIRQKFNVSAAEVEARDHRQLVVLGFAAVGEEAKDVRSCLDQVVTALRRHPVAEFLDHEREV